MFGCDILRKLKNLIKKIDQRTFNILSRLKRFVSRIHSIEYYVEKGNHLLDVNDLVKTNKVLDKGLKYYKNSYDLNQLKANVEMQGGNKKKANYYWNIVIKKHAKRASEEDFIQASESLFSDKKSKQGVTVFEKGLKYYPTSVELLKVATLQYVRSKQWVKVKDTLSLLFISETYSLSVNDFINLSYAYYIEDQGVKAEYIIQCGIQEHKNSSALLLFYLDLCIWLKQWDKASNLIKYHTTHFNIEYSDEQLSMFGMVFQLVGDIDKANYFYESKQKGIQNNSFSHEKITLYDNGDTRIDFYKRNTNPGKVIITFDSINMTWNNPSFGFKLLSEQNIDIIAVQKREKGTYLQDLTLENFLDAIQVLVKGYPIRIAYGFSLGAYAALYYTASLECRILALAPRLSIHPVYGRKHLIGVSPFFHDLKLRRNSNIKPIIVYDPKNKIDYNFIHNEAVKAYPKASLVKVPYGGHSMAPHLLRMGLLRQFILTVIDREQVPVYDRKRKVRSANYYRILGLECLKRNKVHWAKDLADRAYDLLPDEPFVVNFKIDTLMRLKEYEAAEECMHIAMKTKPNRLSYRMTIVDIYIAQGNLIKAEKELEHATLKFGNIAEIESKNNKLQKEYEGLVDKQLFFN